MGDEFLQLEKYVNLNYMGFHKILKKHDKMLPHTPCRQFYISHLHNQPWVQVGGLAVGACGRAGWWAGGCVCVCWSGARLPRSRPHPPLHPPPPPPPPHTHQGNYSDLLMVLSKVYSDLRGDKEAPPPPDETSQGFVRTTTKYWVRMVDVSAGEWRGGGGGGGGGCTAGAWEGGAGGAPDGRASASLDAPLAVPSLHMPLPSLALPPASQAPHPPASPCLPVQEGRFQRRRPVDQLWCARQQAAQAGGGGVGGARTQPTSTRPPSHPHTHTRFPPSLTHPPTHPPQSTWTTPPSSSTTAAWTSAPAPWPCACAGARGRGGGWGVGMAGRAGGREVGACAAPLPHMHVHPQPQTPSGPSTPNTL